MEFGSTFFRVRQDVEPEYDEEEEEETMLQALTAAAAATPVPAPGVASRPNEYRVVVAGCGGVGKSAYCIQFVQGHFVDEYDPTIEDSYRKQLCVDGQSCLLDLLDTAGQEEYSAMRDQYVRRGEGFVVVYDITSRGSFEEAGSIYDQILRVKDVRRVPVILIGNKSDLSGSRVVSHAEGESLAQRWQCPFFETSAKARINIDESMVALVRFMRALMTPSAHVASGSTGGEKKPSFIGKLFGKSSSSAASVAAPKAPTPKKIKRRFKVATSNIALVALGELSDNVELITGEPALCGSCGAALCSACKLVHEAGTVVGWSCAVCGQRNAGRLDEEEVPKTDSYDYILAPAPPTSNEAELVVFCVDVSGSMCVTTEIPELQAQWAQLKMGEAKAGTSGNFASRLQCVKAAIDTHFERLVRQHPQKRVMLVTFSNSVSLFGDGTMDEEVVAGDKLNSLDKLVECGSGIDLAKLKPIATSRDALSKRVLKLEEEGATALGPALAIAVAACAKLKTRSEIVIMTDGLSNIGVGALDASSEKKKTEAAEFYSGVGLRALETNTTISIIGLEGEDSGHGKEVDGTRCDVALDVLGRCCDLTHGTVTIVNPFELLRQVRLIYQNPVIASEVKVAIAHHPLIEVADQEIRIAGRTGAAAATSAARREIGRDLKEAAEAAAAAEKAQAEPEAPEAESLKQQLEAAKAAAIAKEDFDGAKEIKADLAVVEKLAKLEREKATAVAKENFELAKAKKTAFEELRKTIKTPLAAPAAPEEERKHRKHRKHKDAKHKEKVQTLEASAAAAKAAEERGDLTARLPTITVGNALADMDLTFEMRTRKLKAEHLSALPSAVPMQILITFTRPNGMKVMRVISRTWQTTQSRSAAEESMNVAVVGLHLLHRVAHVASRREWATALELLDSGVRTFRHAARTDVQMEEFYSFREQAEELQANLRRAEADSRMASSDATAKLLYKAKSASKNLLLSGRLKTAAVARRHVRKELQEQVASVGLEARY